MDTYNQVANKNLQDLGPQASPTGEEPLQYVDQRAAQWRADESSIKCHLRHSRCKVVAMLALIMRDP
jgi:hypothetical protein